MNQPVTTFVELLDRYQAGERSFMESELRDDPNNDLSGQCLDGINLSRSFIFASFRGASLRNSCFFEANVKTCDFREADLRNADFRGASLDSAQFQGAAMDGARFEGSGAYGLDLQVGEYPFW